MRHGLFQDLLIFYGEKPIGRQSINLLQLPKQSSKRAMQGFGFKIRDGDEYDITKEKKIIKEFKAVPSFISDYLRKLPSSLVPWHY